MADKKYKVTLTDWELALLVRALEEKHNAHNLFESNVVTDSPLDNIRKLHRKLVNTV